ncbi:MAG: hypothetical protein IPK93_03910 [Solirubrobacterales bacterium]|nr:hypothetical protein [Solirubrobacterales bacterium]
MIIDDETKFAIKALESGNSTEVNGYVIGSALAPIQIRAIKEILENYKFDVIKTTPSGISAARLKPR